MRWVMAVPAASAAAPGRDSLESSVNGLVYEACGLVGVSRAHSIQNDLAGKNG